MARRNSGADGDKVKRHIPAVTNAAKSLYY